MWRLCTADDGYLLGHPGLLAHAFLVIATAVQGHTEQSGSNTADR